MLRSVATHAEPVETVDDVFGASEAHVDFSSFSSYPNVDFDFVLTAMSHACRPHNRSSAESSGREASGTGAEVFRPTVLWFYANFYALPVAGQRPERSVERMPSERGCNGRVLEHSSDAADICHAIREPYEKAEGWHSC